MSRITNKSISKKVSASIRIGMSKRICISNSIIGIRMSICKSTSISMVDIQI